LFVSISIIRIHSYIGIVSASGASDSSMCKTRNQTSLPWPGWKPMKIGWRPAPVSRSTLSD